MTYHPSLLTPQARQKDELRRAEVTLPAERLVEIQILALGEAYRGAENFVAYCGIHFDIEGKAIAAASRDRFLGQLRPLLAQLVVTQ